MRLGTSSPLNHGSAGEWAANQKALGCRAVVFPLSCESPEDKISEYVEAARANDLLIAEVGIWKNAMATDPDERKMQRDYCVRQLQLADRIGAKHTWLTHLSHNFPVYEQFAEELRALCAGRGIRSEVLPAYDGLVISD